MLLAASDIAREVDSAFLWIGGACLALLLLVTAAMLFLVFRYHHTRNRRPAQIEGNLALEIAWIVIPGILVILMFFKGYRGFELMRGVPPGAMVVNVTGQKWFWTFEYPDHKFSTDRLHLPLGRPVRFNLTAPADDVAHSFYIPAFRVKEDCVPGKLTYLWIEPQQLGVFNIFCAEFCGKDHSKMIAELEVLAPEAFEAWVEARIADRFKPVDIVRAADPAAEEIKARDAQKLYRTYCTACHGPQGRGGLVEGARDFTSLEGWKNGPTLSGLFKTLAEGIPGTQMRSFPHIPAWDRFALAHRVRAFYPGADLPSDTPEALAALNQAYKLDQVQPPRRRLPIEKAMELLDRESR